MKRRWEPLRADLQAKLDRSFDFKNAGDYAEQARLLEEVVDAGVDRAVVWALLGGAYVELGRDADAVRMFRRCTALSPRSEHASIYLFHSLWRLGLEREAFVEMNRFLSLRDSEEYRFILAELGEKTVPRIGHANGFPRRARLPHVLRATAIRSTSL